MKRASTTAFFTLSVLFGFTSFVLSQQNYRFLKITSENGLSQNSVNNIYEDEFGYLWFCTQDGLNRYDGYEFKIYRPNPEDEYSISDNFVDRIIPDTSGNFWVLCRYGLNYYERSHDRFYKFYTSSKKDMSSASDVFKWSGYLCASINSRCYRLPTSFDEPFIKISDTVRFISRQSPTFALEHQGKLFSCSDSFFVEYTASGIAHSEQKQTKPAIRNQGFKKTRGEVLMLFGGAVYKLDTVNLQFDTLYFDPNLGDFQDVIKRKNGDYWLAHQFGIDVLKRNGAIEEIRPDNSDPNALSYPLVHSLFEDKEGTLWVGTANGGLNYIPASSQKFRLFTVEEGLAANQVWSIYPITEDHIWVGTEEGLSIIKDGVKTPLEKKIIDAFDGFRVSALTMDSLRQMWVGTSKNGLFLVAKDGTIRQLNMHASSPNNLSISTLAQNAQSMWVGTYGELHEFDLNGILIGVVSEKGFNEEASMNYVLSILVDRETLYVGNSLGLHVINALSHSLDQYVYKPGNSDDRPSFQFPTKMFLDANKKLWFSTYGGGIDRFDPVTKKFEFFTTQTGLGNDVVASLVGYKDQIWAGHNKGISCYSVSDSSFCNYGLKDGVPYSEFALGAGTSFNDSLMFFGGTGGLVVFNANEFSHASQLSTPILTEFKINYGKIKTPHTRFPEQIDELMLKPKFDVVSFKFVSPNFAHAAEFTYEYRLVGFNDHWVEAPIAERRATYSSLPAGDYVFQVRVFDQNKRLSDSQLAVPITVVPPIWQRWWFILAVSVFILLTLVFGVRYFARLKIKKQLRELEMQTRIQRERERISMDLHDNVGAQITYLISNLDRLSIQESSPDAPIRGLGKYARGAMRELRDTVWAIRKDSMPISELKQRIESFAKPLAADRKVKLQFEQTGDLSLQLDPAAALHSMRIAQEAINNALKYSEAQNIKIKLSVLDEMNLLINDDGIGFSESEVSDGDHNGLRNMRERASQIDGVLTVKSTRGEGTTISLTLGVNKANALLDSDRKMKSFVL